MEKEVIPLAEKQKEFCLALDQIFDGKMDSMAAFFDVTRENCYHWQKHGLPKPNRIALKYAFPKKWKGIHIDND